MPQVLGVLRVHLRLELGVAVELSLQEVLQKPQLDRELALLVAEPFQLPAVVVGVGVSELGHMLFPLVNMNTLFELPEKLDVKHCQLFFDARGVFQHLLKPSEGRALNPARRPELFDEGADDREVGITGAAVVHRVRRRGSISRR